MSTLDDRAAHPRLGAQAYPDHVEMTTSER